MHGDKLINKKGDIVKVGEILDIIGVLGNIHSQRDEQGKPVLVGRLALQVAKAQRDIEQQVHPKDFEDQRSALLDLYAEKDVDGKYIMTGKNAVKLADPDGFRKAVEELLDTDFEITIPKIPESILDIVNLTGDQALVIEPLLEDFQNKDIKIKMIE